MIRIPNSGDLALLEADAKTAEGEIVPAKTLCQVVSRTMTMANGLSFTLQPPTGRPAFVDETSIGGNEWPLRVITDAALVACWRLVQAYEAGKQRGGSVEWSEVDDAYNAALKALRNVADGMPSFTARLK